MTDIIGVQFQRTSKTYYYDAKDEKVKINQGVIVETARGVEYGRVSIENITITDEILKKKPPEIIRAADAYDDEMHKENLRLAKDAFDICVNKISEHKLDMKLVDAEYTFDKNKLIFSFTADNRVDFRDLVRDLAQIFHTRIELRQIGVRDQAKIVGGIGSCGQELCCHRFMGDFQPVSIKMAKTQGLSLNPTKISGVCGRLMCCLNYEQEVYLENTKAVPDYGTLVLTEDGQGYVVDRDVLQERVRVHVYKEDNTEDEKYFPITDIEILEKRKKGSPKPKLRDNLDSHEFITEGEKESRRQADSESKCESCKSDSDEGLLVATSADNELE